MKLKLVWFWLAITLFLFSYSGVATVTTSIAQPTSASSFIYRDGNLNDKIIFNVASTTSNSPRAAVYYSTSSGGFHYLIGQYDLYTLATSPTNDASCTGGGSFSSTQTCTIIFDVNKPYVYTKNSNLILYYPFDTTDANDFSYSSSKNNGLKTGFSGSWLVPGRKNNSYTFAALNDLVNTINPINFNAGNFTVMGWFNTTYNTGGVEAFIWASGYTGGWAVLETGFSYGYSCLYARSGTGAETLNPQPCSLNINAFNNGQWHQFAYVRSGDNFIVYVDGNMERTITRTGIGDIDEDVSARIGAGQAGRNDKRFIGKLDDIKVYNTALTQAQIQAEYKGAIGGGNYYIDINVTAPTEYQTASSSAFEINLKPVTSDDHNQTAGWQRSDANIHLTCFSRSDPTCYATYYRIDSGSWLTYDKNILINTDGNHQLDYYSIESDSTAETAKTIWMAIDKADVNVFKIDNYADNIGLPMFSYNKDKNLTIDFNANGTSTALSVDINYWNINTSFDRNKNIVSGLILQNLGTCASTNFSRTTRCTWDWNIFNIADGNYKIIIRLATTGLSKTDVSNQSFRIDSNKITIIPNNYSYLDGNTNDRIQFMVTNSDANYLRAFVYFSKNQYDYNYLIGDFNLYEMAIRPSADANCTGSGKFGTTQTCTIIFDVNKGYTATKDNSLKLYLPLDTNEPIDFSPMKNTITTKGFDSNNQKWLLNGKKYKSYSFNGTSNYINAGNQITFGTAYTIMLWARTTNRTLTRRAILGQRTSTNSNVGIGYLGTSDVVSGTLAYTVSGDGTSLQDWDLIYTNTDIFDGNWHHLAVVHNSLDHNFYIDGKKEINLGGLSTDIYDSTANFTIGATSNGTENFWDGGIDDVKIYSKALSATEIQADYNNAIAAGKYYLDINLNKADQNQYDYNSIDFNVDNNRPSISIRTPSNASHVFSKTVSFDLNDDYSSFNNSSVIVKVNSSVSGSFNFNSNCAKFGATNYYCSYTESAIDVELANNSITIDASDTVGNNAVQASTTFQYDANTILTTDDHNAGWRTSANIHLTCANLDSNCYQTYYRINGVDSLKAPYPWIWIANDGLNTVSKINPVTNTIDVNIPVGANPEGVAVDANGNVWVSAYNDVARINPITNTVTATISIGATYDASGIAVDANGNVWVAIYNNVARINPTTNHVDVNIYTGGSFAGGIAVDANQNIWAAGSSGKVYRINPITNHVDANISVGSMNRPGVAVDANQNIWVSPDFAISDEVYKIDPKTNIATQPFSFRTSSGIAVDANGSVWVAGSFYPAYVYKINPATNSIITTITTGDFPSNGIAVDANQNIWVSDRAASKIRRIDPITNTIVTNIGLNGTQFNLGDATGFALQNFVLGKGWKTGSSDANGWKIDSNGWRMFGGLNDANISLSTDGNYKIEYYSVDTILGQEKKRTIWVGIDTIAPVLNNVSPSDGSSVSSNIISFDVNDNIGVNSSSIRVFLNDVSSNYFNAASHCFQFDTNYHCSYAEPRLALGTVKIRIDANDNVGTSASNSFTVDANCDSGSVFQKLCNVSSIKPIRVNEIRLDFNKLVVKNGGQIRVDANDLDLNANYVTIENGGAIYGNVDVNAIDFNIVSGGTINADSFGFPIGQGPGVGSTDTSCPQSSVQNGASHGGNGYNSNNTYDSLQVPVQKGSGAGGCGGAGGGLIRITVSNLALINGTLTADGGSGASGGGILVISKDLNGAGSLTADGGGGGVNCWTGWTQGTHAGGGGRIGFHFDNNYNFSGSAIAAAACSQGWNYCVTSCGWYSSPGTVFYNLAARDAFINPPETEIFTGWDGNDLLKFTVRDQDNNYLLLRLYYSQSIAAKQNQLFSFDLNLLQMAQSPNADYNCSWGGDGFKSERTCYADWNVSGVSNGNYFIDSQVREFGYSFDKNSSDGFIIDNNAISLTSVSANKNRVRFGDLIDVNAIALHRYSNPIALKCGTIRDANNMCNGTFFASNAGCNASVPFSDEVDGNINSIYCRAVDQFGNRSAWKKTEVNVDNIGPRGLTSLSILPIGYNDGSRNWLPEDFNLQQTFFDNNQVVSCQAITDAGILTGDLNSTNGCSKEFIDQNGLMKPALLRARDGLNNRTNLSDLNKRFDFWGSNKINSIAFNDKNRFYFGGNGGKLGFYDFNNGKVIPLITSVSSYWDSNAINSIVFDSSRNDLYLGGASGNFAVFDQDANSSSNLSSKISSFWSANDVNALVYDSINRKIYLGGNSKFGVFNPDTNTATDLSSKIPAGWSNPTISALAFDFERNYVLIGTNNGKLGYYDITANAITDLSSSISGFFGSNSINSIAFDPIQNKVFIAGANAKLGYYDYDTSSAADLSSSASFVGGQSISSVVFDSNKNKLFFGANNSIIGAIDPVFDSVSNLRPAVSDFWSTGLIALALDSNNQTMLLGNGVNSDEIAIRWNIDASLFWTDVFPAIGGEWFVAPKTIRKGVSQVPSDFNVQRKFFDSSSGIKNCRYSLNGTNWSDANKILIDGNKTVWCRAEFKDTNTNSSWVVYFDANDNVLNKLNETASLTNLLSLSDSNKIKSMAFDYKNDELYLGFNSGKLLRYSLDNNSVSNLSNNIFNLFGNSPINSIIIDSNKNKVYLTGKQGRFASLDIAFGTISDVNSKIASFWGTDDINAIALDSDKNDVYLGGTTRSFAVFDSDANTAVNLASSISFWGADAITSLARDDSNKRVYLGGTNGKLGSYHTTQSNASNLSALISGIIGTETVSQLAFNNSSRTVFIGTSAGKIIAIDSDNNSSSNLTSLISSVWGGSSIESMQIDSINNDLYIGGNSAKFLKVNLDNNAVTNLNSTISGFAGTETINSLNFDSNHTILFIGSETKLLKQSIKSKDSFALNLPPILSNLSVSPSSSYWGNNYTYSIDVNDPNYDDVNLTLFYSSNNSTWSDRNNSFIVGGIASPSFAYNGFLISDINKTHYYKYNYNDSIYDLNTIIQLAPTITRKATKLLASEAVNPITVTNSQSFYGDYTDLTAQSAKSLFIATFDTGINADYSIGNSAAQSNTVSTTVFGKDQNALLIDSAADWIAFPTAANIDYNKTTIEFWFNPNWNGNDDSNHFLLAIGDINSRNSINLFKGADNFLKLKLIDKSGTIVQIDYNIADWNRAIWKHIAIEWDGSQAVKTKLFVNGASIGTSTTAIDFNSIDGNIFLASNSNKQYQSQGFYDEFKISDSMIDYTELGFYQGISGTDLTGADVNLDVWNSSSAQKVDANSLAYTNGSYNSSFTPDSTGVWLYRFDANKPGYDFKRQDKNFSAIPITTALRITENSDPVSMLVTTTITVDYNISSGGKLTDASIDISWDENQTWTRFDGNAPYSHSVEFLSAGAKNYTIRAQKANYQTQFASGTITATSANSTLTIDDTIDPVHTGVNSIIHATYLNSTGTNLGSLSGTTIILRLTDSAGTTYPDVTMTYNASTQRNEYTFNKNSPEGTWVYQVIATRGTDSKTTSSTIVLSGDFLITISPALNSVYTSGDTIGIRGYVKQSPTIGGDPVASADINASLYDINGAMVNKVTGITTDTNGFYYTNGIIAPDIASDINRTYYATINVKKTGGWGDLNSATFTVTPRTTALTMSITSNEVDANALAAVDYTYNNVDITDANVRISFDNNLTFSQMDYNAVSQKFEKKKLTTSIGDINATVIAEKPGYAKKTITSSYSVIRHPTAAEITITNPVDVNKTARIRVLYRCNNSVYCDNNFISGADVNITIRDPNNTIIKTGTIDFNSDSNKYDYNQFIPTIPGDYNIIIGAAKTKHAIDMNSIKTTAKYQQISYTLADMNADANEDFADDSFIVNGTVTLMNNSQLAQNASVSIRFAGTTYSTTTNSIGVFSKTITTPAARGIYNLDINSSDSNNITGHSDQNIFIRKRTTTVAITGNVYRTDSIISNTAKPGQSVTITYSAVPSQERAKDFNVILLFPDWNYGNTITTNPTIIPKNYLELNSTDSNSFTFTVPNKESQGNRIITIRAQWTDINKNLSKMDYNLAPALGDRNNLFITQRKAVEITDFNSDYNAYTVNTDINVHAVLSIKYNAQATVASYKIEFLDSNGSALQTFKTVTTPFFVQPDSNYNIDANFNPGIRPTKTYTLRITVTYYDESSVETTITRDYNISIGSVSITVNPNKQKYSLNENITIAGTISTQLNLSLPGKIITELINYSGNVVRTSATSGLTITKTTPYSYSTTFNSTGLQGSFTAKTSFWSDTNILLESSTASILIGTITLTIISMPTRSSINSSIDINVHVSGLNGDNNSLAQTDFNVWDGNGSFYTISNFKSELSGNYSFRIKFGSNSGTFLITIQAIERLIDLNSTAWAQQSISIALHALTIETSFGATYKDYNLYIPSYNDKNIASTTTQSISNTTSYVDYYSLYNKNDKNNLGIIATSNTPFLDITNSSQTAFSIKISSEMSSQAEELYLIFSQLSPEQITARKTEIKKKKFLERISPSFSKEDRQKNPISIGIDYSAAKINLINDLNLPIGQHTLLIKNEGTENGKVKISVQRQ